MDHALHPVQKYLLHRLLIIDTDKPEVDLLARILSTPPGTTERRTCETIVVGSLAEAEPYIESQTPTIAIIDPAITAFEAVLEFVAHVSDAYRNVIWLINTSSDWWDTHAPTLESHPFGPRLKRYYRRTKQPQNDSARESFLDALHLCRHDLLLDLISCTANDLQKYRDTKVTSEQLEKFASKLFRPGLLLVVEEHGIWPKSKIAYVSIGRDEDQFRRYEEIIAPTLDNAGYKTIALQRRLPAQLPIPDASLAAIHEASLFVADLTEYDPEVLLELSVALAKGVPLIFLAHRSRLVSDQLPATSAQIESTSDDNLREQLSNAVTAFLDKYGD